ncbi:hypothetical protein DVDV_2715 [Desulfovibrio sp. DV]|nr:hypothetical protein DVDV_2715 [Desulfovibrio sp. DV]
MDREHTVAGPGTGRKGRRGSVARLLPDRHGPVAGTGAGTKGVF